MARIALDTDAFRDFFRVAGGGILGDTRAADGEGNRAAGVGTCFDGGEVIGGDKEATVPVFLDVVKAGGDDFGVEIFDGLDLKFDAALVACFVGGFDVEVDHVVAFEGVERGGNFGGVVGINPAGGSRDVEYFETGAAPDTLNEIDGGNDGTGEAEFVGVGFDVGGGALSPEPN